MVLSSSAASSSSCLNPSGLLEVPSYWMVPSISITATLLASFVISMPEEDGPTIDFTMLVHDVMDTSSTISRATTTTMATIQPRDFFFSGAGAEAGCGGVAYGA